VSFLALIEAIPGRIRIRSVEQLPTQPPEEREAARDLRRLAREVLAPAQLEVFDLSEAGIGYRRASVVLGISRVAVRDRATAAERRLAAALRLRSATAALRRRRSRSPAFRRPMEVPPAGRGERLAGRFLRGALAGVSAPYQTRDKV
jgi:hypothetical protein